VEATAQGGASATWQALSTSEGQFIYNLFRRQLAVLIPTFDPLTQIEADLFMQRSFYLRDLHMSPAALSVLIPLAPPGLNFSCFWVSDVRVSWVNLLSLDQNPIVCEIDSIQAQAGEIPAGNASEVDSLITDWLDVVGGLDPVRFVGRYPLLDGATFRVRNIQLDIDSPSRYGKLRLKLEGVDIVAVDSEGRQRGLIELVKAGMHQDTITFNRLVECSEISALYVSDSANSTADAESGAADEDQQQHAQYLLDPTPLAALLTQRCMIEDLRRVVAQKWTLAFPGATRFHTIPPLLTTQPEPPPPDPRLVPFPPPATEYHVRVADGASFQWYSSAFVAHRPQMHPIAAMVFTTIILCALLALTATCSPRPWLQRLLSRRLPFGQLFC